MKKLIALLLAIILVCGMLPAAFAEGSAEEPAEESTEEAAAFDYVKLMSKRDNYKYDKKNKSWSWNQSYVKKYYDANVTLLMKVQGEKDGPNPAYTKLYVKVLDKDGNKKWTVESLDFLVGEDVYSYQAMDRSGDYSCVLLGEQGQQLMAALAESDGENVSVRITAEDGNSKLIKLSQKSFTETLKEFCRVCQKYDIWGFSTDKDKAAESEQAFPLTINAATAEEPEAKEEPAVEADENAPYGIPLYASPEEVDLAAVLDGHNIKKLIEQFGGVKETGTQRYTNGSNKYGYINESYVFLDSSKWLEPQYVNYNVNSPEKRTANGVTYLGSTSGLIYNSDFYNGKPFYISIPEKNSFGAKSSKSSVSVEVTDNKLEGAFLWLSGEAIKEITKTELTDDGMYRIYFDLDLESSKLTDCSVVIDPETSLIQKYSYKNSFIGSDNKTVKYTDSTKVEYGLEKLPDYSAMVSEINKNK